MTSHKPLKSISHNFGHSFISFMNYINDDYFMGHLLKQARKTKCDKLTVDILNNLAEPAELLTDQIKSSIGYWTKWFPTLVESSGSTMDYVSAARMIIEFDLQQTRPHAQHSDYLESSFTCEIVIIDDRNKEYKHKHEGWWFPESK
jgi:hypothetical protein